MGLPVDGSADTDALQRTRAGAEGVVLDPGVADEDEQGAVGGELEVDGPGQAGGEGRDVLPGWSGSRALTQPLTKSAKKYRPR